VATLTSRPAPSGEESYKNIYARRQMKLQTYFWKLVKESINKVKGKANPFQACTGPEGSRRLRHLDLKKIGIRKWYVCQPYALAAFAAKKYTWYSFLLEAESIPAP
jgi:hypothetical protein